MYPFFRFAYHMWQAGRAAPIPFDATHENETICWPWDLDLWNELNNGRTLTLYDIGRIPMAARTGLIKVLRQRRWGLTVAGSTIRYRRRVQAFARLKMRTRLTCWDERFFYMEQSMWKRDGECASHVMLRTAVISKGRIVPTAEVAEAMGVAPESPPMPDWIAQWVASESARPWPPMSEGEGG